MSTETQQLLDLEAIKKLKARYFRCMDSKDWDGLESCFTEDLHADFRGGPGELVEGRANYMPYLKTALENATTVHHGHMPEIHFDSESDASGTWAMDDIVIMPGIELRGWGHYLEHYRKQNGEWRIRSIRLTRLRLLLNGEEQDID